MRVAQLMVEDVRAVGTDTTVAEAVVVLADSHISALPVVDRQGKIVGVLSTTDILGAAAECGDAKARDELFEGTPVRDLMTSPPATIELTIDVKEAAQQMLHLEVHRLFVEDRGKLVGVISQSDIVRAVATAQI
jgi:CBS domain-containing membrane protein